MVEISRRCFLLRGGASLAGAIIAVPLLERFAAVVPAAASPAAIPESPMFPGTLPDLLSSIVADLEGKFPYASALFTARGGITIRRDRHGKNVSESNFPSFGTTLRVFDGSTFHEAGVGSTSADELRGAAQGLLRDVAVGRQRFKIEPFGRHEQAWRTEMKQDPDALSLAERTAMVDREFERADWDDPRVRNVTVTTSVDQTLRVFVDGRRRLSSNSTLVGHSALVFGFDKGRPGFGFVRNNAQGGLELATLSGNRSSARARTRWTCSAPRRCRPATTT
jgi:hypothetical protein